MGDLPDELAARLVSEHGIRRAVETGTLLGAGTKSLARLVDHVETIELARRYALRAKLRFLLRPGITVRHGDSATLLRSATEPTLYWLDGHWSGGATGGVERECPVLDEIRATSPGDPGDCYLIDDARFFVEPPPPPHNPSQWPTFEQIRRLFADVRPHHSVEIIGDVIVAEASRRP